MSMHLLKMTMLSVFFDVEETHVAETHMSILPLVHIANPQ